MITVTEWAERYEVSSKNFPAVDGEQLRAGPLQYIRLKVHGHSQGVGWRRLKIAAGDRLAEVFGIFCKLLEIAGNQKRGLRGQILNEKGLPASANDIAFILDMPTEQIVNALSILTCDEIGWLADSERKKEPKKETTQDNSTQHNSSIQENPVITGFLPGIAPPTKTPCKKIPLSYPTWDEWLSYCKSIDWDDELDCSSAFNHYVACGWVQGKNKSKIVDWHGAARGCRDRAEKQRRERMPV